MGNKGAGVTRTGRAGISMRRWKRYGARFAVPNGVFSYGNVRKQYQVRGRISWRISRLLDRCLLHRGFRGGLDDVSKCMSMHAVVAVQFLTIYINPLIQYYILLNHLKPLLNPQSVLILLLAWVY